MKHLACIMDGNRRWAKQLWNIPKYGHEKWAGALKRVIMWWLRERIPFLSFWALSKENIEERSLDELTALYQIIKDQSGDLVELAHDHQIRIELIGDLWLLPPDVRMVCFEIQDATCQYENMTLILAIGYGGQDEILRAVRSLLAAGISPQDCRHETFLEVLDSGKFPPPDLIVRTGWAKRHSGFLLYQSAYSEYLYTDTLWPDIQEADCDAFLLEYQQRKRNYGK